MVLALEQGLRGLKQKRFLSDRSTSGLCLLCHAGEEGLGGVERWVETHPKEREEVKLCREAVGRRSSGVLSRRVGSRDFPFPLNTTVMNPHNGEGSHERARGMRGRLLCR